jgi:hypothetical protein
MALSMRTAAMAAAVGKESLSRTRVRAAAPSMSSASCSPSCSGSVSPASRAVSVVACVLGCGVLGVVEFDGRRDVGAQGRGRGHLEGGEESFPGCEVGAVEHPGHDVGIEPAQVLGDEFVLVGEVLVGRALGYLGHGAELVHAGAVDALIAEQLLRRAEDALACAPAAAPAQGALLQLRHASSVDRSVRIGLHSLRPDPTITYVTYTVWFT